jgi:hypothetical protein
VAGTSLLLGGSVCAKSNFLVVGSFPAAEASLFVVDRSVAARAGFFADLHRRNRTPPHLRSIRSVIAPGRIFGGLGGSHADHLAFPRSFSHPRHTH